MKLSNAFFARLFGTITFLYLAVGSMLPKVINVDKGNVGFMMAIVGYFLKPPSDGYNSPRGASEATEGE
jgi:hypothetical protein